MRITVLPAGAACETKSSSLHQQTSRVLRKTEPGKRACELLTHFSEQALISVYCRNHYASSFFFSLPVATKVNKPHQREPREPTASSKNCTAERTMKCGWCLGLWGLLNANMTFQLKRRSSLLQAPHVTRKTHLLALANRLFRRVLHPKCLTEPSISETGEQLVIRPRFPNSKRKAKKTNTNSLLLKLLIFSRMISFAHFIWCKREPLGRKMSQSKRCWGDTAFVPCSFKHDVLLIYR